MKLAIISSALAAALIAAAPAPASAGGITVDFSVSDGFAPEGRVILADHGPGYGRYGRCESWRFVHRKLHRRFEEVNLIRQTYNRGGDKIYIVRARNYRGHPLRIRYNACLGRVVAVTRIGHRHGHHRY